MPIENALLDIEGTTTPVDFVYQVLFPYARARAREFIARRFDSGDLRADLSALIEEHAQDQQRGLCPPPLSYEAGEPKIEKIDSLAAYVDWLMEQDRKSTPLKSLQGKIWEEGYGKGELQGRVFADVPLALKRWRERGKKIFIFSSGSVLAQKLLFASTTAGDLTHFIDGYFDTTIGPKKEAESYRRIARAVGSPASEIIFISDIAAELDAARGAGMQTALSARPGNAAQPAKHSHQVISSFDDLSL